MPNPSHLADRARSTANAVALRLDRPYDSKITLVHGASGGNISADVVAETSGDWLRSRIAVSQAGTSRYSGSHIASTKRPVCVEKQRVTTSKQL